MRPLDLLAPQDRFLRDAMQLPRDLSQSGGGKSVGDPPFQLCGSIDDLLRLQFAVVGPTCRSRCGGWSGRRRE